MPFSTDGKNAMLNALGAVITHAALYSDDAGTTEISGGTPAYARKSITWAAADAGSMAASNAPAFDVPASTTVKAVGFMTAVSGGTRHALHNVTDEAFAAQGVYTLLTSTLSITDS